MTTIADFTIEAGDFPLGHLFESMPEVTVQLDRVVPTNHALIPYFWVWDGDVSEVGTALADHPEIESVTLIDDLGDEGLFRAEWTEEARGILTAIAETDVVLVSGTGGQGEWLFRIRAENADDISAFQQYCQDHDVGITLTRLHRLTETRPGRGTNLTDAQDAALRLAFLDGYYDEPRGTDLASLAAKLDITRQSVAARLRRGHRTLVADALELD